MAKRKLLQVVVLASIFAVTSCNDSSSNPDATDTLTSSDSTADIVDPNGLASSSSFTIDDNEILTPLSSDGNGLDIPVTSSDGNANPSSSMDSVSLDPTSSSNIEQTIEVSSNDGEKPTSSSAINEQNPASSTFDGQKPESSTGVEIKSSSSDAVIQSSSAQEVAETGIFLTEDKDETRGHIDIEYQQDNGPDGQSILAYPKQLSTTQKHAIVVWGARWWRKTE